MIKIRVNFTNIRNTNQVHNISKLTISIIFLKRFVTSITSFLSFIPLPNTMFGWGEFREDGKDREKNREEGKLEGNFLSRAHKFHPPKSGGKAWREKCSHNTFTIIPYSGIK